MSTPFPLCRAEHWRFYRDYPEGVRQGCRTLLEEQESLPANLDKIDGAQEASGIGRISFGYFSLTENCSCIFRIRHIHVAFRAKKSISSVGTRTHIQTTVALATPYISLTLTLSHRRRGNKMGFTTNGKI